MKPGIQSITVTPIGSDDTEFIVQWWGGTPDLRAKNLAEVRVESAPYGQSGTSVEVSWPSTSDKTVETAKAYANALSEAVELAERLEADDSLRLISVAALLTGGIDTRR